MARLMNEFEFATKRNIRIISGFRTDKEQEELIRQGRLAAPVDVSNHTICPAQAVDISLGFAPSLIHKRYLGMFAVKHGIRWGGGSRMDDDLVPLDWQHFDLGPRLR
jgi:hypothetical protein